MSVVHDFTSLIQTHAPDLKYRVDRAISIENDHSAPNLQVSEPTIISIQSSWRGIDLTLCVVTPANIDIIWYETQEVQRLDYLLRSRVACTAKPTTVLSRPTWWNAPQEKFIALCARIAPELTHRYFTWRVERHKKAKARRTN